METIYKEIFQARNKMYTLKNKLNYLHQQCSQRFSNSLKTEIDDTLDEIHHLDIRMMILEKLTRSKVYF